MCLLCVCSNKMKKEYWNANRTCATFVCHLIGFYVLSRIHGNGYDRGVFLAKLVGGMFPCDCRFFSCHCSVSTSVSHHRCLDVPCVSRIPSRFLTLPIVATFIAILACGTLPRTMLTFRVVSVVKLLHRVNDILTHITNRPYYKRMQCCHVVHTGMHAEK